MAKNELTFMYKDRKKSMLIFKKKLCTKDYSFAVLRLGQAGIWDRKKCKNILVGESDQYLASW